MHAQENVGSQIVALYRQTADGRLVDCNDTCAKMLGFESRGELIARGYLEYVNRSDFLSVSAALQDLRSLSNVELAMRRRDGSVAWMLQNLQLSVGDEAGQMWIDGAMFDVTEQRTAVQRFEYQAYHDSVTSLPNRMLFIDRAEVALASARRRGVAVGFMMIDIDNFATINTLYGRGVGDRVLRSVAEKLHGCIREDDSIARFTGDDFMVILGHMETAGDAAIAANRMLEAIAPPIHVAGETIRIGASIGLSVSPNDGTDIDTLIRAAAMATSEVRKAGGGAFRFHEPKLNARAAERATIVARLRQAIEKGELELHYQPEVNVQTGRIDCIEALVRWRHPDLGILTSGDFLGAAEQGGLMNRISDWVVFNACHQLRNWHDQGLNHMRVAVNLSPYQLGERSIPDVLQNAADEAGIHPGSIEVEIPELGLSHHNAREVLKALKEVGVLLAIDDFGSGGASFGDLKNLPIDTLKIAPQFVHSMINNTDDAAIVQAMITMAKGLDLRVVAEGVESKEQLSYLLSRRCAEMQGYFVARPMPAVALDDILRMQQH